MCFDLVKAYRLDVIDGCCQTMCSDIVRSTCLKLKRQTLEDGFLESHAFNHLATTLIRWHAVEPFLLTIEYANTRWSIHLMAAESKEVAIQILYIDFEMWRTLCAVNQYRYAVFMSDADDFFHRVHRSQHIADMCNTDKLRFVREQLLISVHIEDAVITHRNHTNRNTFLGGLQLPRNNITVMLHHGYDNLIPLVQEGIAER